MAVDTTFVGFHSRLHCGIKFFGVHYILVTVKVLMFYQIFTFVSDNFVAVVGNEKKGKIVYPFIHLHDMRHFGHNILCKNNSWEYELEFLRSMWHGAKCL